MPISSRTLRATLLTLALTLSGLALSPSTQAAECTSHDQRWVFSGQCCGFTQGRYYGQSCINGTWVDDGSWTCLGGCPV
jgi:hypothetical protein